MQKFCRQKAVTLELNSEALEDKSLESSSLTLCYFPWARYFFSVFMFCSKGLQSVNVWILFALPADFHPKFNSFLMDNQCFLYATNDLTGFFLSSVIYPFHFDMLSSCYYLCPSLSCFCELFPELPYTFHLVLGEWEETRIAHNIMQLCNIVCHFNFQPWFLSGHV